MNPFVQANRTTTLPEEEEKPMPSMDPCVLPVIGQMTGEMEETE
jgi:hypothetical protein